ncbi:unnamed protein product [Dibothriocephalus latus]|uniref:Uncharacterized protein n=1 Tax=Dibothriocephalus latus TaxID=60516 RepID=A0A3P6PJ86_DIBLA|nr:unnamed protein product [Dibothriocephalus latus]
MASAHFFIFAVRVAALRHQEKFTIRAGTNLPVGEHYFRVTGKTGKFKIVIEKEQTVIQLNGPMQSEPVYLQFSANEDGSGKKFTLKICPDNLNCAVDNQADVRAANADYKRPSLETQPVNTVGNAENRKPPPEIKHVDTAANAGYNRRLVKEHPTSTATNVFSLVLIFMWSARLLVEM